MINIERYFKNLFIEDITIEQSENTNTLNLNINFLYTNLYTTVADNIILSVTA